MKLNTCCFTGHRQLPRYKTEEIIVRLDFEIEKLINQGVTEFISGGALGFDQIAASLIVAKKELGANIRLAFALPCRNQDEKWTSDQRRLYHSLLSEADDVRYISEKFSADCMRKRNFYMVDNARYCICALLHETSGTAQTVRYAQRKGLKVINVAK